MRFRKEFVAISAGVLFFIGCSQSPLNAPPSSQTPAAGYLVNEQGILADLEGASQTVSSSDISYVVVRDGTNRIKFEDAAIGLGEEKAVETDVFEIAIAGPLTQVTVKTKSADAATPFVLTPESPSYQDELGFVVTVLQWPDGEGSKLIVAVTSVAAPHALSHIEFIFDESQNVDTPDLSVIVERTTYDLDKIPDITIVDRRNYGNDDGLNDGTVLPY